MNRRQLLSSVVGAGVGLAGCNGPSEDEENDERVRIVDHALVREHVGTEDEIVAVEGRVEQLDDDSINYIELRARFLGPEEEVLDTTSERVEDVDEDGEWAFRIEAALVGERAASVESYELEITTVL